MTAEVCLGIYRQIRLSYLLLIKYINLHLLKNLWMVLAMEKVSVA